MSQQGACFSMGYTRTSRKMTCQYRSQRQPNRDVVTADWVSRPRGARLARPARCGAAVTCPRSPRCPTTHAQAERLVQQQRVHRSDTAAAARLEVATVMQGGRYFGEEDVAFCCSDGACPLPIHQGRNLVLSLRQREVNAFQGAGRPCSLARRCRDVMPTAEQGQSRPYGTASPTRRPTM